MKSPQTFIIIGNGVAAWRVNAELERKFVDAKILRIASETFVPACSFRSTAINCLRGTQRGISALGDLIVDSHEEFCSFMDNHGPKGVTKAYEYQIWDENNPESAAKWERRFGAHEEFDSVEDIALRKSYRGVKSEAYLIDPYQFYQWHIEQLNNTEEIDDHVIEVTKSAGRHRIITQRGREFFADKIFLCAGHSSPVFSSLISDAKCLNYLSRSKPVKGAYLYKAGVGSELDFSLALEGKHLIFRNGDLLIGSTSENDSSITYQDTEQTRSLYDFVSKHLSDPSFLPKYDEMEIKVGVRHKGPKRAPFWGECAENIYGIFGLYKNGFSFSFKAAKDLVSLIN